MIVNAEHLLFYYRSNVTGNHLALHDISFYVEKGEIIAIAGATGSGKTTLVQLLNGLLKATSGSLHVFGMDLTDPNTNFRELRRRVGLVFQFPELQLFEETVKADVAFGPRNLGLNTIDEAVRESLHLVGLDYETYAHRSPFHLSNGERRRAAIAGVVAVKPDLLILDEPTVGLDQSSMEKVEGIIHDYRSRGNTVIFISHDMDLVARQADRVIVLRKGKQLFQGSKESLFLNRPLLESADLEQPHITQYLDSLRREGYPVRENIWTISQARQELNRLRKIKKQNNGAP